MSAEIIAFRKRDKPKEKPARPVPSRRWEALDALRGLCVIGMIALTGMPTGIAGEFGPDQLLSAAFLFCMGMAIPLSLAGRAARQSRVQLMLHIGLRTVILIALGLVLSNVPGTDLTQLKFPGVLQFAGLCYGVAALLCLSIGRKSDVDFTLRLWPVAGAAAVALAAYAGWLVFRQLGAPDLYAVFVGGLDLLNAPAVLGGVAVVLLGVAAALFVRKHGVRNVIAGLAFLGALLLVGGGSLAGVLPVDGALWTPTFALVAGGLALIAFALVAIITEIPGVKAVAYPLRVFGGNALLAFAAVMVAARLWPMTPLYAGALLLVIGLPLWALYVRRVYLTP